MGHQGPRARRARLGVARRPARDACACTRWIGGDRPEDVADAAAQARAAGLTAVKMNATEPSCTISTPGKVEAVVERGRGACATAGGAGFGIGDRLPRPGAQARWRSALARSWSRNSPLFIEEPVLPEHNEALREIARHTSVADRLR